MSESAEIKIDQLMAATLGSQQEPEQTIHSQRRQQGLAQAALEHGVRRLGYVMGEELGRGALGRINSANQQVFDRAVAIKRLLRDGVDHEASLKFYAEAVVTAQLEHPNIVPIHDLLAKADGSLQLVMKRVEGVAWRDLLRPRTEPQRRRAATLGLDDHIEILLKVCNAVAFAHGRGILHRDIKPDNVMVGEFGEVLLMDWGCAVAFGETEHHPIVPRVEEITEITGTPSYMAPEMAVAKIEAIGPQSDVYQLGAVLYDLLTGSSPHRGRTVREVLTSVVQGKIPQPQAAAPDRFVPEELASVAMAALARDPHKRMATVAQFIERLRNYQRHAQAIVLVGNARGQMSIAAKNPKLAAESLRKATSWAEQALEIWPNWSGAKSALLDARLADAQHSFSHGSYTLAAQQGEAAAVLAKELERIELVENAQVITVKARAAMSTRSSRELRLRLVRISLACLGVALAVALAGYLLQLRAHETTLLAELQEARHSADAGTTVTTEPPPAAGAPPGPSSAPALDQARTALAAGDWQAATAALDQPIAADPEPQQSRGLRAAARIALKNYSGAREDCAQWLALAPGDAHAQRLSQLLQGLQDGSDPTTDVKGAFADIFNDLKLNALAQHYAVSGDDRLSYYRQRLNAAWPGMGDGLSMGENQRLSASGKRWTMALAGHAAIRDLAPLHGLPLVELDLRHAMVADLAPLQGMPLEYLDLEGTAVTDLAPLQGMPLVELDISGTRVHDLAPLAGSSLKVLRAEHTAIADCSPLRGISFQDLDVSDTLVADLSFLERTTQHELHFARCPIRDISPLLTTTIDVLDLSGCPPVDATVLVRVLKEDFIGSTDVDAASLQVIARMRGVRLDLGSAPLLKTLAPLAGKRLQELVFHGSQVRSLEPLQGMPLETLICDYNPITDLGPLAGAPLATLDITGCPVGSVGAASRLPLVSLHASRTALTDRLLADLKLQLTSELWIDHTRITDVRPLARLPLINLRVGPFADWKRAGVEALRPLASLRFIGVGPDDYMEAGMFWHALDAGTLPAAYVR